MYSVATFTTEEGRLVSGHCRTVMLCYPTKVHRRTFVADGGVAGIKYDPAAKVAHAVLPAEVISHGKPPPGLMPWRIKRYSSLIISSPVWNVRGAQRCGERPEAGAGMQVCAGPHRDGEVESPWNLSTTQPGFKLGLPRAAFTEGEFGSTS